jgi:hypothetical protein
MPEVRGKDEEERPDAVTMKRNASDAKPSRELVDKYGMVNGIKCSR